jgi:hypothetical protein
VLTQTGELKPFGRIALQQADPQANGAIGATLIVVWLAAGVVATYVFVKRWDPQAQATVLPPPRAKATGASTPATLPG